MRELNKDAYDVGTAVGAQGIEYLLNAQIHNMVPFLMTVYRGDGLRAHLDKNIQGYSKDSKADQLKKISFGMRKGRQ